MSEKSKRPQRIHVALESFLDQSGLRRRVEQAAVVPEWPSLVGPAIAAVTQPLSVTADGTLFVAVKTHAWMTELSLLEPQLLASINDQRKRSAVRKIRWQLMR